jgi:Ca2+-binding RTX toxin-like protein
MFETLDSRRLMAASATLFKDGVLGVLGTSGSDRIAVTASAIIYPANDAGYGRVENYVVTANGKTIGTFDGNKVSKIKIFGLGGNDRISGVPEVTLDRTPQTRAPVKVASMYVEGGSGRDRIVGSYGNDTLKGQDGNDDMVDYLGRNWIEGGRGDDIIRAFGTRETIQPDGSIRYTGFGSGKNKILAGDGIDTVFSSYAGDTLLDVPEDTGAYAI